jgi:hypothetical protein
MVFELRKLVHGIKRYGKIKKTKKWAVLVNPTFLAENL